MAKRFEIIASNTGDFFYHQIADNESPLNLRQTCELLNSLAAELHALKIQPDIERLEELRDFGRFHQTTFDDKCGFMDFPEFNQLVEIGIYKDLGVDDDGWNRYERIADTDSVINAEIKKLKQGGE